MRHSQKMMHPANSQIKHTLRAKNKQVHTKMSVFLQNPLRDVTTLKRPIDNIPVSEASAMDPDYFPWQKFSFLGNCEIKLSFLFLLFKFFFLWLDVVLNFLKTRQLWCFVHYFSLHKSMQDRWRRETRDLGYEAAVCTVTQKCQQHNVRLTTKRLLM